MWSWMGGLAAAALLLARPEAAADGARAAMAQWYHAVAPSLFPFMALGCLICIVLQNIKGRKRT